jgi:hypothetical protein
MITKHLLDISTLKGRRRRPQKRRRRPEVEEACKKTMEGQNSKDVRT